MPAMRFGVLSFARAPYAELVALWRWLEELGFDSLTVNDDMNVPDAGLGDYEPWTLLAALARETTRVRLGTLVTVVTFRHPSFLASQIVTVDHISGGRVDIRLGSGGPPNPYSAYGYALWTPRERFDRLAEYVPILDRMLRGEAVTASGPYYPVENARVSRPTQQPRPPLILAAHGRRGLRLTSRYADGWTTFGGQPYPVASRDPSQRVSQAQAVANTSAMSEQLDQHCHEIGRDPATIRRSILAYGTAFDPLSSPDAFDEYVGQYQAAGIDEINFYWPSIAHIFYGAPLGPAQRAMLERIARDRFASFRA